MKVKTFVIILSLSAAYFGSTWFFFGSSHPCEILVARQKDQHIYLAEKHHQEDMQSWQELGRKILVPKDYERFAHNIEEYTSTVMREENLRQSAVVELRQKLSEMTPAQCAWEAITWQ